MKKTVKQLPIIGMEEEKKKRNPKLVLAILIVIGILIITLFILYMIFIYNSPSNKLKRYLTTQEYTCYKKKCVKKTKDERIEINFKTFNYSVINQEYTLTISNMVTLDTKDAYSCTYPKQSEDRISLISDEMTTDKECRKHIDSVNNYISNYQKVLREAKVSVKEISK